MESGGCNILGIVFVLGNMKNLILLFVFLPFILLSQDKVSNDSLNQHYFGVHGGYNYSLHTPKFGLTGNSNSSHRSTGYGGLSYRFYPKSWIYFSAGAQFGQVRFSINNEITDEESCCPSDSYISDTLYNSHLSFDQIAFPIMIGFNPGNKFFGIISIGFITGLPFNRSNIIETYHSDVPSFIVKEEYDHGKKKYLTFNFAFELGFGFKIKDFVKLCFSAKYFTSPINGQIQEPFYHNDEKKYQVKFYLERSIRAEFGLYFNLKKKTKKEKPIEEIETQ